MSSAVAQQFRDRLLRYSQEPDRDRRQLLEAEIWRDYGSQQAVLVLDMSGFSMLTDRYGIVHYLSMVRRMQLTAEPIITGFGGVIIKFEADNAFATFAQPVDAVRAALALNLAFSAANVMTPDELDIRIACGIDYGPILLVDGRDFFGDAVNRASKLGEDLAQPGEILISASALQRIDDRSAFVASPVSLSVSGVRIDGYSLGLPDAAKADALQAGIGDPV